MFIHMLGMLRMKGKQNWRAKKLNKRARFGLLWQSQTETVLEGREEREFDALGCVIACFNACQCATHIWIHVGHNLEAKRSEERAEMVN